MGTFFNPTRSVQLWSCGGGVQSAAIAALILKEYLPRPTHAVFVDTTREKSSTMPWWIEYAIEKLTAFGVNLTTIKTTQFGHANIFDGVHGKTIMLPGFTTQNGGVGKLTNYCSGDWKRDVVMRWARSVGVVECDNWLGFSLDEIRRCSADRKLWFRQQFPLIELKLRRGDCESIIREMGWPVPSRSSCWMCPNQSDREWADLKRDHPSDFQNAVKLEREIREKDQHFYLHQSCQPLDAVVFSKKENLLSACESGHCFI